MKAPLHTCAAQGCQHQIPKHLLMCVDHWRMVPVKARQLVLATYKGLRGQPGGDWQARHDAVMDYRKAVARAVAALDEKQNHKLEERKAEAGDLFN